VNDFLRVMNSDRYQYTESNVFIEEKMENKIATFDMFFRKVEGNGFAVVSGISDVLELIDIINNTDEKTKRKYLSKVIQEDDLVDYLVNMKFTGSISGLRDGEIAYPNEPVLTITAPLIQAKILETPLLNILNHQMAVATKTSRVTRAAKGVPVSAFGSRRAHGFDSAVKGSKASYIAGCDSHSNLVAEYLYGIKSIGTMAHSYVQSFGVGEESEYEAFDKFIKHNKEEKHTLILLIDTYNTLEMGLKNAIKAFKANGIDDTYEGSYGVRLDSGDLAYLSKKCRLELNKAGLMKAKIALTNSLDEYLIRSLLDQGVEADLFGVGDSIAVSKDNPCFGGVYKIVEIDNKKLIKLSNDIVKISNPGKKEIYRLFENEKAIADLVVLKEKDSDTEKILNREELIIVDENNRFNSYKFRTKAYDFEKITRDFIVDGKKTENFDELVDINESKKHYEKRLTQLLKGHKRLDNPHTYMVDLSMDLYHLKSTLIKKIKSQMQKQED
jgi:nicotinate phosphoribosyltransferase